MLKNKQWSCIVLVAFLTFSCQTSTTISFHKMEGATMGTTWHITYEGPDNKPILKEQVDSLLHMINQAASTYIPSSLISRLNQGETIEVPEEDPDEIEFFRYNASIAEQVWKWSNGYFDPTVMELVNYWGFGYEGHRPVETVDSATIDSLLQFVGYEVIGDRFQTERWSLPEGYQLDFSAVAKGGACDRIAEFFEENKITNYLIEIGGEMLVNGPGRGGEGWIIGVSRPQINAPARELIQELVVRDRAVATSGNYRNYYESQGHLFTHTINPRTGYSEKRNILSATVIAEKCGVADALATAIMAMGLDESKEMLKRLSDVEGYLIYNNGADSMLIYETAGINSLKYNTKQ